MSRTLTEFASRSVVTSLNLLASPDTSPNEYKRAMYQLGVEHGRVLRIKLLNKAVGIACTVEDADFLAKGIIDGLEGSPSSISIACFWNKRFQGDESKNIPDTAPIQKRYAEPSIKSVDSLIVAKSIISGACVVKTNLTNLIRESNPSEIFVVAPVMFAHAKANLEKEFPADVSQRFEYAFFAEDDDKASDGNVLPGIGGNVYQRLGFDDQDGKNRYTPELVITRRRQMISGQSGSHA
ncbi:MAG: hypothetical protein HLX50_16855 [Alteromonadaceae bacterium]|nr:hypothetical protein [Alteromonadaceae bacterium]